MDKETIICMDCGHQFEGHSKDACLNCESTDTTSYDQYLENELINHQDDLNEDEELFS